MLINQFAPAKAAAAGIVAATLLVAGLAWFALRPATAPAPQAADAPAAEFPVARAMGHVRFLAEQPRPIASAANAEARQYILDQLRAHGPDATGANGDRAKNQRRPQPQRAHRPRRGQQHRRAPARQGARPRAPPAAAARHQLRHHRAQPRRGLGRRRRWRRCSKRCASCRPARRWTTTSRSCSPTASGSAALACARSPASMRWPNAPGW